MQKVEGSSPFIRSKLLQVTKAANANAALALIEKGDALDERGLHEDAMTAYAEVAGRFADASNDVIRDLVARALISKALVLGRLGRHDEEIELYDELITRYGEVPDPDVRSRVAWVFYNKGYALVELGRPEDGIAVYDELITRFGNAPDARLRERVVWALSQKGAALVGLKRIDQAIETWDATVVRFHDSSELQEPVAYVLANKSAALRQLGREDEARRIDDEIVARVAESSDPDLRVAVARALIGQGIALGEAGRRRDAIAAYDTVIRFGGAKDGGPLEQIAWALYDKAWALDEARKAEGDAGVSAQLRDELSGVLEQLIRCPDEVLDDELCDRVGWALLERAKALDEQERFEEALDCVAELLARFGEISDSEIVDRLASALEWRAYLLGRLSRSDEQLTVYDDLINRFRDSVEPTIRQRVAEASRRKAQVLDTSNRRDDAIAAYDDALSVLVDMADARETVVRILVEKGETLRRAGREEEAVVVFESVVAIYRDALRAGSPASALLEQVVCALLDKNDSLSRLGRSTELAATTNVLSGLLPDLIESEPPKGEDEDDEYDDEDDDEPGPDELKLATLLAKTHRGDTWLLLATAGDGLPSRELMAERASSLYARTTAWFESDEDDEQANAAALVLRLVADGFAMLSRAWPAKTLASLSLPNRPLMESAIRKGELDEWAARLGHPLELGEDQDVVEAQLEEQQAKFDAAEEAGSAVWESRFAGAFVAAMCGHELLALLCDSRQGRDALQLGAVQRDAAWRISEARKWTVWTSHMGQPEVGVAMLLVAEAWFMASRGVVASSADLFPSRNAIQELVQDASEWLVEQGVELPEWFADDLENADEDDE